MDWRQILVSLLILVVCAVKLAEAVLQLENYPLSRMSMFAAYRGPDEAPWSITLEVRRKNRWVTVTPFLLGMRPSTFRSKLGSRLPGLSQRCGALGELHNRGTPLDQRWTRMRAVARRRARPGSEKDDREVVVPCLLRPLSPAARGAPR